MRTGFVVAPLTAFTLLLAGCAVAEPAFEQPAEQVCNEYYPVADPILSLVDLATTASTSMELGAHVNELEEELPKLASIQGPTRFGDLTSDLFGEIEQFIEIGRSADAGETTKLDVAHESILQSAAKISMYCGR
ncbi:hypothetical protein M0722_17830 [Microbacterium sp. KSW4-16]|uniref:hypothetical protein n=1 Tax=Microbacterium aurugineum TaxID=2851642 RepID=UPI0020BD9E28|nr:hypothetical protein [Microbacterium aurugineum]MCK8469060.1 hypothetical protein [Microbacterium aurugineum]